MTVGSVSSAGKKVSFLSFLITLVLAVAAFVYLTMVVISRDLLWFWPGFNGQPSQIVVHCYGQEVNLDGTASESAAISALVNRQISGDKRWDDMNLTDETHEYYLTDPGVMVLELYYAEPIRVHMPNYFFSGINSLLIPLDGRFATTYIVFGLINDHPAGGSFHILSTQPIVDYLAQSGLCSKP